jgi:membrane protease YdiL (CAAX protease family)
MSNASSKPPKEPSSPASVPWNPWVGAFFALFIFFGAQFVAGFLISIYPLLRGWTALRAQAWLDGSLAVKLVYLALITLVIFIALRAFLRWHKSSFKAIGLRRPKWTDPLFSLAAFPVYVLLFVLLTATVKALAPGLDVNQAQDLGFNATYTGVQLIFIAIGLVILPPVTEEVIFRGFLYSSLKKGMPILAAAIVTSLLFAAGHLAEGGGSGPLYIAAIDTFVLSMVLVYLREKTGGLWAGIGLHALKNGIAFVSLFLVHAR